jgi:hypothetical protein
MTKQEVFLSACVKSRKLGLAVFSGNDLIYYNQHVLVRRHRSAPQALAEITKNLFDVHRPKYLVIDQLAYKQQRVQSFMKVRQSLIQMSKRNRITMKEYLLDVARTSLCSKVKPVKNNIAQILTTDYPELKKLLPVGAKWQLIHYQPLLNAVILGAHFLKTAAPKDP